MEPLLLRLARPTFVLDDLRKTFPLFIFSTVSSLAFQSFVVHLPVLLAIG
jgi:hypothetical protein